MELNEYKKSADYKKSQKLISDFKDEILGGNINKLINTDLSTIIPSRLKSKYKGGIDDPDMYLITQAIYILVWGNIYNLEYSKMGPWSYKCKDNPPFRGDTMNSFNSVYGKDCMIANEYKLNTELLRNISEYQKLYHSIGNFIVIPNRNNVNRKRGNNYTIQDFFDSFVGIIYQFYYNDRKTDFSFYYDEMFPVLSCNEEYKTIKFEDWIRDFFLDNYIDENCEPINVFNISLQMRKKEYHNRKRRSKKDYYSTDEYELLASNYYNISKKIINYRAEKIVNVIRERLKENN